MACRCPSSFFLLPSPLSLLPFLSGAQYDVDDVLLQWTWGSGTSAFHTRTRDFAGRVAAIKDFASSYVPKTSLTYDSYDGDGDAAQIQDSGPHASILTTAAAVPATRTLSYEVPRDLLKGWTDVDGLQRILTFDAATAHRTNEQVGAANRAYTRSLERILQRGTGTGQTFSASLAYTNGSVVTVSSPIGTTMASSISYGPRGDITSLTAPGSVGWTYQTDHEMNRWKKTSTGGSHVFRYDVAGRLLERVVLTAGGSVSARDEYIWFGGMPVGVTHTDTTYPAPKSWYLSSDAMGTPRRILDRTSLAQISRLVLNPWGEGTQIDDRGATFVGLPSLPFRLPGQIADTETTLVENKHRYYYPTLGVYLSPDPAHGASATSYAGPQAYAYAGGRPLVNTDPDGRLVTFAFSRSISLVAEGTDGLTVVSGAGPQAVTTPTLVGVRMKPCGRCNDCSYKFDAEVLVDTRISVVEGGALLPSCDGVNNVIGHEIGHANDIRAYLKEREGPFATEGFASKDACSTGRVNFLRNWRTDFQPLLDDAVFESDLSRHTFNGCRRGGY